MNSIFIATLNKKFANQFTVELAENNSSIIFPAKSPEFGDVEIYEECVGAYIVYVGKFTHCHIDCYTGSEEEQSKEAAKDIINFLENIFADRVICCGSHEGGGGFFYKGDCEDNECTYDESTDFFTWSGIYKKGKEN